MNRAERKRWQELELKRAVGDIWWNERRELADIERRAEDERELRAERLSLNVGDGGG